MPTRDENLATVQRIRDELTSLLEGMDYCLDWKDGDNWCAREVLYHLVDTPEGGIGSVIAGVLGGTRDEVTIVPDINNVTPERTVADIGEALAGPWPSCKPPRMPSPPRPTPILRRKPP